MSSFCCFLFYICLLIILFIYFLFTERLESPKWSPGSGPGSNPTFDVSLSP